MADLKDVTLCILGCDALGNLGIPILKALFDASNSENYTLPITKFIACVRSEPSESALKGRFPDAGDKLKFSRGDKIAALKASQVVILGVDPGDVESVLSQPGTADALKDKLLISVAAGWTRGKLESTLYGSETTADNTAGRAWVVRTLPNIAAMVSQSLTAIEISDPPVPAPYMELTEAIFEKIGKAVKIAPKLMNATTAVGGSTPAFWGVICDAMIDAAVAVGVPRNLASTMIFQSMLGSATLMQNGLHPSLLRDQGTSPEGFALACGEAVTLSGIPADTHVGSVNDPKMVTASLTKNVAVAALGSTRGVVDTAVAPEAAADPKISAKRRSFHTPRGTLTRNVDAKVAVLTAAAPSYLSASVVAAFAVTVIARPARSMRGALRSFAVPVGLQQTRTKATVPFRLPDPRNEPNPEYRKGSPERAKLEEALNKLKSELPARSDLFYNGQVHSASKSFDTFMPHAHGKKFSNFPLASKEQVAAAIDSALEAKKSWENTPFVDRAAIFLKAAELVVTKYRYELIAATMLGQGKNMWQGEIDAAAELADFFRLNCNFAAEILEKQPERGSDGMWSRLEWRPLEGFVYAVSPFNFTAIGGNLISGPALLGNVVLWKPSPSNIYASQLVYNILLEAGLPPNVIQFVPGDAEEVTDVVLKHREFAGLNFVGSSDVFRSLYAKIGEGIGNKTYRDFPKIVGETSGKNYHLIHPSADIDSAALHTLRGAFEYQGQKCSATSRVYIPQSRADEFLSKLTENVKKITIGSPDGNLNAFMGPVIHDRSFEKIKRIIDESNKDPSLKLLVGGTYDGSNGYYVNPTVYLADSPEHRLFNEEIFGPVLAVNIYPDAEWSSTLKKVDQGGGGFALTGAVFAKDRTAIREAEDTLRYSAGNFYINCKTTAALIGQQSFGGARSSGTNDKAGSADVMRRFTSPRLIKEEFFPLTDFEYPSNK
ncbi:Delta-1-pyrroline-5-carboxylate dehydrogenase [Colletotrichum sp. SAR11_59]|nr:Delta-1-pyrroline-5-carboxylate dehydrogenase [Colletotrichum sp. SAR11_59]